MKCVPVHHGIPAVLHGDEPWLHRHSENGALQFICPYIPVENLLRQSLCHSVNSRVKKASPLFQVQKRKSSTFVRVQQTPGIVPGTGGTERQTRRQANNMDVQPDGLPKGNREYETGGEIWRCFHSNELILSPTGIILNMSCFAVSCMACIADYWTVLFVCVRVPV